EVGRKMTIRKFQLARGLICFTLLSISSLCAASEADLKPGDTIGPENWEKVKGMVGENLLNRIKQGYTLRIKESRSMGVPKEYNAATGRYSGEARLGSNGELLNYVGGLPFSDVASTGHRGGFKVGG